MEYQRTVGLAFDLIALFMNRAVMAATEHREIRQRRRTAACPVADVMPLPDTDSTPREATAAIPMLERSPERRRNRPGTRSNLDDPAVGVVAHHDTTRVTRNALGRFRGNARTVLEDGLARVI